MLAVDRYRRDGTEVGASANVGWLHRRAKTPRLLDGFIGVRVRDVVLANDDLRVDTWLVDVAENLDDPANRASSRGWPARDLTDDHIVCFGSAALSGWHMNVRSYTAVKRNDIGKSRGVGFDTADDRVVRSLDDADDPAFQAARCLALDAHEHTIAMHGLGEVRRGDVNVPSPRLASFARVVGNHESKAARIRV